ncbi:response regulator receiver domain-containing protein [Balneicella halophila]|uniref:Response regulator receiver domain-containing protein n=2 Tax=Balneicella halophila TaxID=1537566 RepID=A0A7L4UQP9_BALHA|nr:response regulator receiver domain-containing protein [Balneicella halophila]
MNRIELSKLYKRTKSDRDIFHELMPYKVKDILLVATYYDAYSIVREGQFSDKINGEYLQLNLYSAPRFVNATTNEEAMELLKERHFDMIIIMTGMDKEQPLSLSQKIRKFKPEIPLVLLVNNNSDLAYFSQASDIVKNNIDQVFVWNGSTRIFMAMIKYIEDKMNIEADVKLGDVRVILLVEDSVRYYSRYLPMLYTMIMKQTQNIIDDEDDNISETQKIIKVRARPKIILVSNYEAAQEVIDKYDENLLCLISDVRFPHNGVEDDQAGVKLIEYLREQQVDVPVMMQSTEVANALKASKLNAHFINKNSDTLATDVTNFLIDNLGFGNFIFRNPSGTKIAEAHSIEEFEEMLRTIPDESLIYHAQKNALSTWLMVRGEVYAAKLLRKHNVEDYKTVAEMRQYIMAVFERSRLKQLNGRIIPFRKNLIPSNHYILRLGKGSLGGKGRGLAFISNFISNVNFSNLIPEMKVRIPRTAVIGIEEFRNFLEINDFEAKVYLEQSYEEIEELFLAAPLPEKLSSKLYHFLETTKVPIAVRSSGLFEDSLKQPFAGVYRTYLLSNNQMMIEERLEKLEEAIKLVYASIFTDTARSYFKAVDYKIEEEQMAVVIQEVVGNNYNGKFYPTISGVAQSYNYYPFSYMKPDDGFAVMAVGLGMAVVGGEPAHRFCPKYPKLDNKSLKDQIRDSQKYFYAIDMNRTSFNLERDGENACIGKYTIKEAEEDGNLRLIASTYDAQNDRLEPGITAKYGPRVIDFANILKYNALPVAKSLELLLHIFKQAMGTPIEIEFSIDLDTKDRPTIYLLQIKPLLRQNDILEIDLDSVSRDNIMMHASNGMGNGEIEDIKDVIYVDLAKFDKLKTEDMAQEISQLNDKMKKLDRNYILVGPGRWGTRDKTTGIPVSWASISNAKVIVEQGLENFPLDASLGSHFFHNVISMNVGYYSMQPNSDEGDFDYDTLDNMQAEETITYFRHIHFDKPLRVLMDGRSQKMLVTYPD